ncbi:MAG: primosomal protein N' [Peptostreptococcaceae bacterium]|nr:primosomal protein N' [Peptostreptococcaceae bacterium]
MSRIASVIIKHRSKFVDREYSYLADETVEIGSQVIVPFGRGNKPYDGIVIDLLPKDEEKHSDLKPILRVTDHYKIPPSKLDLAKWIRHEYMSSLSEALNLFVPRDRETEEIYDTFLIPTAKRGEILAAEALEKRSARNKIMLLQLLGEGEVNVSSLQREFGRSYLNSARAIENMGLALLQKKRVYRIPQSEYEVQERSVTLSPEQEGVIRSIEKNVEMKIPTLLHGITGSGKTEVYIQLIENCIHRGKRAIVLVPEISLTPQTIARFRNIFGERIGVFHSKISQGERKDQTDLILDGKLDLVIGARSALFSPVEDLGLVIIDECHDDAYRSEQSPKYDTIEVARKLCHLYDAGLVLGTATPTVEQYYEAVYGNDDLQTLRKRERGMLPSIEIIDTNEEIKAGSMGLISSKTMEAIEKEIEEKKQVIVFLNKRGYAVTLSCSHCDHTVMCPFCDISLTYHKEGRKLLCHYCGHSEPYEKRCRACEQGEYQYIGYGTQRIEAEILEKIKGAKTVRLDRDTTQQKGGHERLLKEFKDHRSNVLIGTQMISKGLDFENVSLVIILNADQGLRFPDYRSAERTLSMMIQVSGRAGRGEAGGRVIIQTNDSGNKIFEYAKKQDYQSFFWDEIKERKAFFYPPFASLLKIQCTAEDQEVCANTAERIKDAVDFYLTKRQREVITLGPVPNLIRRIENRYRWQLFYKVKDKNDLDLLKSIIGFILSEKRSIIVGQETAVSVEINPKSLI